MCHSSTEPVPFNRRCCLNCVFCLKSAPHTRTRTHKTDAAKITASSPKRRTLSPTAERPIYGGKVVCVSYEYLIRVCRHICAHSSVPKWSSLAHSFLHSLHTSMPAILLHAAYVHTRLKLYMHCVCVFFFVCSIRSTTFGTERPIHARSQAHNCMAHSRRLVGAVCWPICFQ